MGLYKNSRHCFCCSQRWEVSLSHSPQPRAPPGTPQPLHRSILNSQLVQRHHHNCRDLSPSTGSCFHPSRGQGPPAHTPRNDALKCPGEPLHTPCTSAGLLPSSLPGFEIIMQRYFQQPWPPAAQGDVSALVDDPISTPKASRCGAEPAKLGCHGTGVRTVPVPAPVPLPALGQHSPR